MLWFIVLSYRYLTNKQRRQLSYLFAIAVHDLQQTIDCVHGCFMIL